jgi:hypothetical protein
LYAQGNSDSSDPTILNVIATSKSVCPTSTLDISFTLKNGRGSASSGAYFTTSTQFTIILIYLNSSGNAVIVNSGTPFSLTTSEIPSSANDATSLPITRTYTIPITTVTRTDYRMEISSANPNISNLSRSSSFTISDNNYWSGVIDSDWNKAKNWDCDLIPSFINNAIVNNVPNTPILNNGLPGECKNLKVNSGSSLKVIDNTLNISETVSNSGTFNSLNGSVAFVGTAAQTIPANTFSTNRIRNLIINNTAGVSSSGNLEITGFLRVENGNFNTGNKLTLISNATQTALINGSGNGQVVGTVNMQRYIDPAFGYKYFSSPFSNSIVGDFSPYVALGATFPQAYYYDENSTDVNANDITGWKPYTDADSAIELGTLEGYAFNFGTAGNAVTVELSGTVNNGAFTRSLSNNNGTYTDGYNLIGNPYPSPINWDAPEWTKTNIDGAIYFFSASSQYKGTYSSYVNTIPSTADGISSNIIPSMQGFFVHVSDGGDSTSVTNGILALTNAVRVNDFTQQFIKKSEPAPVSLIRLSAGIKDNSTKDAMVIYFDPFAELSFEKDKDALKLMNTDVAVPNLYSLTPENKKLSINALPKPGSNDVKKIPLGFKTEKDGWMSIGLQDLQNLPSNFNVYLIDSEKRIGQNLSRKAQYRFYAKSGQHDSRFHLIFSETELSDPAIAFDEPFSVRTVGGKVMVSLNLDPGQSGVLLASNVTGQILDRKNVSEKETIEIVGIKSSGVYFFSINLKDGMFSKKVLIQK